MNEKISKLLKKEEEITDRLSNVYNAITALCRISKTDRFLDFLAFLRQLEKKEYHLKEMQTKIREKIKKEQDKCTHKYPDGRDAHTNWNGNDHNWDYYTCEICNHEIQR